MDNNTRCPTTMTVVEKDDFQKQGYYWDYIKGYWRKSNLKGKKNGSTKSLSS